MFFQIPFRKVPLLALFIALSCSLAIAQEDTLVNLSGRVVDADGKGIPEVSIILKNSAEAITDSNGYWTILSTSASAYVESQKKSPFGMNIRGNLVFLNLPKAGHLNATVFDLSGKSRFPLLDENIRPGDYKIHLDETKTPHGTWLVRINTPSGTQVLRWSHQGSESTATIQALPQSRGYKTSILAKASGVPDTLMVQYQGNEIVRMEQANVVAGTLADFVIVAVNPKMNPASAGSVIENLPLYVLVGQPFDFHVSYLPTSWRPLEVNTGGVLSPAGESQQNVTLLTPKDSVVVNFVSPIQQISFSNLGSKSLDAGSFSIGAISSSQLPVSISSNTPEFCTFSGDTAHLMGAGRCQFTAMQAGNFTYDYISVDSAFTISKGSQSILLDPIPDQEFSSTPYNINATASSGLLVSYTSLTPFKCTITDGVLTFAGVGVCTFIASQAGNVNYNYTQDTITFNITKSSQTIYAESIGNKQYLDAAVSLSAVASSGLAVTASTSSTACSITNNILSFLSSGICEIVYSQAGNGVYMPAELINSITIAKAPQTLTLHVDGLSNIGSVIQTTYNPQNPSFIAQATSNRGLSSTIFSLSTDICTVSGTQINPIKSGICLVYAMNVGNIQYDTAYSDTVQFLINKAAQTITLGNTSDRTFTSIPFTISASATSGLPVVVTSNSPSICTVLNNSVQLYSAGSCELSAAQAGNDIYLPGNSDVSLLVIKANQTIPIDIAIANRKLSSGNFTLNYSTSVGLPVQFISTTSSICDVINQNEILLKDTGTCNLTANAAGDLRYNDATPVTNISFTVEPN